MRRRFNGRGLIAAVVLTAAALAGSVTPASAATGPDGSPVLNASSRGTVHHCEVLGPASPSGYEAVVCVDINTATNYNSTGYLAQGEIEAFCKIGAGTQTVPCQHIAVDGVFANADNTFQDIYLGCNGVCPAGRFTVPSESFNYTGGHDCASSLGHNVWTVALSDTTVVTPDGDFFSVGENGGNDDGNYSSGHAWICP